MVDQATFMETVHAVQEIVRTSQGALTREDIAGYFQDMDLDREQQNMIYDYLMNPSVRQGQNENVPNENAEAPEECGGELDTAGDPKEMAGDSEESSKCGKGRSKTEEKPDVRKSDRPVPSKPFQMYLEELERVQELRPEETKALYQALAAGDASVISEISSQWLRKVVKLAQEYKTSGALMDDMVQEGNIGLLTGLQQLLGVQEMPDMEERLSSFVREAIESYLETEAGAEDQENFILAKVSLIEEAKQTLTREDRIVPTLKELAAYTRIPEKEIADILALAKEISKRK